MTNEPEPPLQVRADLSAPDHAIVAVGGEVDLENASELERRLVEIVSGSTPTIVDLTGCTYMDSSGFRTLHRAADIGRMVLVVPPEAFLARVVRLAGLNEIVMICDDTEAAITFLRTHPQ